MTTCLCGNPVVFESVLCPRCQALRTLELGADATETDIKATYHMLVKVWHPDRFQGDTTLKAAAEVKLKEVNSAYALLTATQSSGGQRPMAGSGNGETPGSAENAGAAAGRAAAPRSRPAITQSATGFASIAPALRLSFKLILVVLALLMARYLWIAFDVDTPTGEVQQVLGYGKDSLEKGLAAPRRRFLAAVEQDLQRLSLWSPAPSSPVAPPDGLPAANPASERVAIASAPAGARQTSNSPPVTRKVYSYITVGSTRDEVLDQLGVGDVAAHEDVARVVLQVRQRLQIPRVRQLVEVDDGPVGPLAQQEAHEVAADEAGAARHQHAADGPGHNPSASAAVFARPLTSALAACKDSKVPASVHQPSSWSHCSAPAFK